MLSEATYEAFSLNNDKRMNHYRKMSNIRYFPEDDNTNALLFLEFFSYLKDVFNIKIIDIENLLRNSSKDASSLLFKSNVKNVKILELVK